MADTKPSAVALRIKRMLTADGDAIAPGAGGIIDAGIKPLLDLLRASKREHRYVDDTWYSCPKATEGCADDGQGDECNCGADKWNARVDEILRTAGGE